MSTKSPAIQTMSTDLFSGNDTYNVYGWEYDFANNHSAEHTMIHGDDRVQYLLHLISNMEFYWPPVIIFPGIIGNVLVLVVLLGSSFRKTSVGFLLCALAVADTGTLISGILLRWSRLLFPFMFDTMSVTGCRVLRFSFNFFPQLSSWTIVLVTFERLIAVIKPLHSRIMCSHRRIVTAWIIVCGFLVGINILAVTQVSNSSYGHCLGKFNEGILWFYLSMWTIIPMSIVTLLNAVIIFRIIQQVMNKHQRTLNITSGGRHLRGRSENVKSVKSVTIMLITCSSVFILISVIGSISLIFVFKTIKLSVMTAEGMVFHNVAYHMCYSNFAINFLLYCVSGRKFRKAMVKVLCCRDSPRRQI